MTQAELKNKIKSRELVGSYLLVGEEDYLKRHYLSEIEKAVLGEDNPFLLFNKAVFDGGIADPAEIRAALEAPPMMAEIKLVEWKYPDIEGMRENEKRSVIELSEVALENPHSAFVIIASADGFEAGSAKRPSKSAKRFEKSFNIVNFEKSTEAQLASWLARHFAAEGVRITAEVPRALILRSGRSMDALSLEVKKLSALAKARGIELLSEREVNECCASTLECDAFALSSAITDKNRDAAYTALLDMKNRRLDAAACLASLSRSFSEIGVVCELARAGLSQERITELLGWNSYRVKYAVQAARRYGDDNLKRAIARLAELDVLSKSGGVSGFAPIEIFIGEFI